jgi:hypothetical protein
MLDFVLALARGAQEAVAPALRAGKVNGRGRPGNRIQIAVVFSLYLIILLSQPQPLLRFNYW